MYRMPSAEDCVIMPRHFRRAKRGAKDRLKCQGHVADDMVVCGTTLSANSRACATCLADFPSVPCTADGETSTGRLCGKVAANNGSSHWQSTLLLLSEMRRIIGVCISEARCGSSYVGTRVNSRVVVEVCRGNEVSTALMRLLAPWSWKESSDS